MSGNCRSGCSRSSIGWNKGPLKKELEKVTKELKGSATVWEDQQYELTSNPQNCVSSCVCSKGWPSRPSMGGEAPWSYEYHIYAPVEGNARVRKWEWVGWGAVQGKGVGDFQYSI